jgi:hypothetical protein
MSKEVKYTVKIKNPDLKTLEEAMNKLAKALNISLITANTFRIWQQSLNRQGICFKLPNMAYPVDVFIEDGQIKLHGDEMDMRKAQEAIEQFYKITYMEKQVMTLAPSLSGLRTDINYDKEKEKVRMEVAWF